MILCSAKDPNGMCMSFWIFYLQLLPLCYCPATSSCSVALNHVLCFSTQQGQGLHFTLLQFGKCSQEKAGKSVEFTGVSLFKDYNLMFPYGVQWLKTVAHVFYPVVQFLYSTGRGHEVKPLLSWSKLELQPFKGCFNFHQIAKPIIFY